MPIKIPNQLPATATLTRENIFVMTETRAITQDIRPLQILLLNLMPTKVDTETQLARVLGNTPLQIQLELIAPSGHVSKNTSQEHMLAFYRSFDEVRDRTFDGLIITGAPVENLPFEEVDYWPELCEIMEWSKTHVHSTLHICWGAQAGLYYHYGIPKRQLPQKLSGVFRHTVEDPNFILFRGFDDEFWVPHSRNTTVLREDIEAVPGLKVLSFSPEAGVYAVKTDQGRQITIFERTSVVSSRILRELFADVTKTWKFKYLSEKVNCSIGQVSKLMKVLIENAWVEKLPDGYKVIDPESLLLEWSKDYGKKEITSYACYSLDNISAIEERLKELKTDTGIDSYLTGLSGGVRYTPVVRYNKVHVYIAPEDIQEAIRYLDMKEVNSGSNVVIFPLENDSYIKDYRVIGESAVVSPLQIYLDCMQIKGRGEEMADAVLKKEILR